MARILGKNIFHPWEISVKMVGKVII